MEKINVIYILGPGHCGSTLVELVMGSSKECFSLGEIAFYNVYKGEKKVKNDPRKHICTCKEELKDCIFWSQLYDNDYKMRKFFSLKENISLILSIIFNKKTPKLTDDSYKLFRDVLKLNPEAKYVIDSSKDPRRLKVLLSDERLNVIPVFLFRSNGATARSYSKPTNSKPKNFWVALFIRSFLINLLSKSIMKTTPGSMEVRYEEFCRETEKNIKELNSELGINIDPKNFLKEMKNTKYHNIGGNSLRFREVTEIRLDDAWRKELPPFKLAISKLLDRIVG